MSLLRAYIPFITKIYCRRKWLQWQDIAGSIKWSLVEGGGGREGRGGKPGWRRWMSKESDMTGLFVWQSKWHTAGVTCTWGVMPVFPLTVLLSYSSRWSLISARFTSIVCVLYVHHNRGMLEDKCAIKGFYFLLDGWISSEGRITLHPALNMCIISGTCT